MAVSLTLRRNWYLIPICIIALLILIYFGDKRVISVNIGDKGEVTTDYYDIENTIDLFDTTQVHEVKILMTEEEYKDMIDTYSSTSEKDWYKTDIIIDGVTIYNVGVRLKGNSSLRGLGGNDQGGPGKSVSGMDRGKGKHREGNQDNRMMGFHGNRVGSGAMPPGFPGNGSGDMMRPEIFQGGSFGPGAMSGGEISYDTQLPLFIKFNKYEDQTYQGHQMISLRVGGMGNDVSLLAEPYSYELYQEAGSPAPSASYGAVQIDGMDEKLFIISELPEDDYYIKKWFGDDNGVLYKAGNFIDFSYQGEDPTEYSDSFTQKTRVNDYDLSPLIKMLKFVSNSTDEEFEEQIDDYIDVDSVLTVLAIDDFVGNQDSFGGMGSNYYLYYHLGEQRFYLLTWDQNLAFGGMGGGMGGGPGGMGSGMNMMGGMFPGAMGENFSGMNMPQMGNNEERMMPGDSNGSGDTNFPGFPGGDFNPEDFSGGFPGMPGEGGGMGGGPGGMQGSNTLKTRLLANETFKARYDEIYAQIEEIALSSEFSESFFNVWTNALLKYNESKEIINEENYLKAVESLKSYLENKKE